MPSPAAGYLPKPLKGSPRQSFAPFCRFPSGASAKYRGRAAHAHEQPQAEPAPVQFSLAHQRGAQALPSPAAGYLPKPLKGPPRQSFAPLARTAAGRACACSIQLGTPKGSSGFAVTRRRVSAETPEGAPSAELRSARANSRRQSLRLFNSAWHTKGEHRQSLCPPLVCPPGIEPGTYSVGGCHSIQLRYGHICRPFGLLLL